MSSIKNITYALAGGFTGGSLVGVALKQCFTPRTAGAAYGYFPYVGVLVGVTAAVSRAVDEIFKAAGWTDHRPIRLIASHVVVGIILAPIASAYIGRPYEVGRAIGVALTIASFAINVIVK